VPGHYSSFAFREPFRSGFDAPLEGFRLPVEEEEEEEQEEQQQQEVDFSIPDDTSILEGLGQGLLGSGAGTFTIDYGLPTLGTVAGTPGIAGPVQFLTEASDVIAGGASAGAGASTLPFGLNPLTASYLLYNLIPAIGNQISGQTDPLRKELSRLIAYKPGTGSFGKQQKGAIEFNTQLRDFAQALVDAGWDEDRGFVQQVQDGDPDLLSAFYDAASEYPSVVNYFVDRFGEGIFDRPVSTTVEQLPADPIDTTTEVTNIAVDEEIIPDVTPPVTTQDTETGGEEDSSQEASSSVSQEEIQAKIDEAVESAVSSATSGLLTEEQAKEQAAAAVSEATEGLFTPEQVQQQIDGAVDNALSQAKIDSDQALADALAAYQDSIPEDTTIYDQDDVDQFVTDALSSLPEDTTPFTQEDIDQAVTAAIDSLPEDTTEFNQEDVDSAVNEALGELQQKFIEEKTGLESTIDTLTTSLEGLEEELAGEKEVSSGLEINLTNLKTTLETAQSALAEQQAVNTASQAQIESLSSSVNTLNGTVDNLTTKLAEVTQAKEDAIEAGNKALADALEQAEQTLQSTKDAAQETLQNAIAAGETKVAEAVAAGETAVADAVAAGEAAAEAAEAAGREEGFGEGFGEGQGQGRGEGAGAGLGAGLGLGLGLGLLRPGGVTQSLFKDFKFTPTYQAPELQEAARQFETPNFLQGLFRDVA
jgi:hypothetical protein